MKVDFHVCSINDALSSVISIETKSSGIHWREVGCSST